MKTKTNSCVICGSTAVGTRTLDEGVFVCEECFEISALLTCCDDCGKSMLATNALRIEGNVYCRECIEKTILEDGTYHTWEEYNKDILEEEKELGNGQKATVEGWLELNRSYWEEMYMAERKVAKEMLEEEKAKIVSRRNGQDSV